MKTFLIAIFMFIIGFIVGANVGVNFTLNSSYDYLLKNVQNISTGSISNIKQSFEEKKQELIIQFKQKKEEIIQNIKNNIKEQLKQQIENIFK